jgi:hypothetical protein
MKLFQQLLVAPAALGLLATGANAAELNINGVAEYSSSSKEQVTSVTQFSDVYPTDWAYQALSNLVEQYGCVAGYPNGTFRGNRALTRYEAAALLNACLDRVTEVTDQLKSLISEFEKELAMIAGKVDGLEARVGEISATQFSTTTKLSGYTAWVMGAATNAVNTTEDDEVVSAEKLSFSYDLRLKLATSFTGKDELTTVLRSGNFNDTPFNEGLTFVETAMSSGNVVKLGRLFYTFPVGDSLSVTAGPIVRTDDASMYAGYATFYPSDLLLDFFTYGGAPTTNNLAYTGSGIGGVYTFGDSGLKLSGNYVAVDGADSSMGIGTSEGTSTSAWQLFYEGEVFGGSFLAQLGYSYEQNAGLAIGTASFDGNHNGYSVAAAWKSADSGVMPSISTGYSIADPEEDGIDDINSWYLGLEWNDVGIEGNSLGGAIGEAPSFEDDPDNFMWEVYYSFSVSDNITVTPAIFGIYDGVSGDDGDIFGGLVKTTFTF